MVQLTKGCFTSGVSTGIFSQPPLSQAQSATHQAMQTQLMVNAVQAPGIHPDERDMTIVKFNLLQAYSGTGQGVASHLGQAGTVQLTAENPFCRFKVRPFSSHCRTGLLLRQLY